MDYWNLVLRAFQAALGWWTEIIAADNFLLYAFFGLIFANMVTKMFILPFVSGMVTGAGSDFVSSKRRTRFDNYHGGIKGQRQLPGGFD